VSAPEQPLRHLIDTHCHLDVEDFASDREAVLGRARAAGVAGIVVPAIHAAGWAGLIALCEGASDLYPALGLHPIYLAQHRDAHISALERALADVQPVAIGEIGLDYFVRDSIVIDSRHCSRHSSRWPPPRVSPFCFMCARPTTRRWRRCGESLSVGASALLRLRPWRARASGG